MNREYDKSQKAWDRNGITKLTLNNYVDWFEEKFAALEGDVILTNDAISLRKVSETKCLGIQTWDAHILSVRQKVSRNLNILKFTDQ